MSSTVRQLIRYGQETLEAAGKDGASFDARALLSFVMDIPFRDVPLKYDSPVSDDQRHHFEELLRRRLEGEPLQYITGEQEFMGLIFHVDERVLIPRLDTEILAEEALEYVQALDGKDDIRVLDLCCGSGAIGLSAAKLTAGDRDPENIRVVLSDISEDALEVAKANADALKVSDRVAFIQSDLFEDIGNMTFDLIVSNPPYVRTEVIGTLDDEVKSHEPRQAIDGGPDGLDIYRKIIAGAADHLKDGGCLMLETGFDQAEDISDLLEKDGRYDDVVIKKDLAGLDRVAECRKRL